MDPNFHSYLKGQGKYYNVMESKWQAVAKRTNALGMHLKATLLRAIEICEGFMVSMRLKLGLKILAGLKYAKR